MPSAFVIPGAGEPSRKDFEERVGTFAKSLGADWTLEPIWWSDGGQHVGRIREGLPSTYPPAPGWWDLGDDLTVREAEAEFRVPGVATGIWHGRQWLLDAYAGVFADALLYWGKRETIQPAIVKKITEGEADAPIVNVIAHSLGGLIAVDLAAAGMVRINRLVTFGTPVSVAYVLDRGRIGLPPYEPGKPVRISHIARWTNLWNKYDPVALHMAKVFALPDGSPRDIEIRLPDKTPVSEAHLAYWELDAVRVEVRRAFSAQLEERNR